eukprot:tig00020918_g15888.t1
MSGEALKVFSGVAALVGVATAAFMLTPRNTPSTISNPEHVKAREAVYAKADYSPLSKYREGKIRME